MTRAPAPAKRATRAEVERLALDLYASAYDLPLQEAWQNWQELTRAIWRAAARRAIALGAKPPAPKRRTKP